MSMTKKAKPDWAAIERDYRTGRFTLRELQEKHGPTASTIMRRAKKEGWEQDLSEAVRQATKAKLLKESAQQARAQQAQQAQHVAQQALAEVVDIAAEENKQVVLRHRSDITKTRNVALALLEELSFTTTNQDELERLLELSITEDMTEDQVDAMRGAFRKLMSLSGRVGSAQKLADTLTKLQALERKAFDLDKEADDKPKDNELTGLMDFLREGAGRIRPGGAG